MSFDSQNLVESIAQYGYQKIFKQEEKEDTLPENIPVEIPDSLNIVDYVGKIICVEAKDAEEKIKSRKMRRIDIE